MADEKYAIKPDDNQNDIHKKHQWLIRDQQNANRKIREQAAKPIPPKEEKVTKESNPTTGNVSEAPTNPDAPPNNPSAPSGENK